MSSKVRPHLRYVPKLLSLEESGFVQTNGESDSRLSSPVVSQGLYNVEGPLMSTPVGRRVPIILDDLFKVGYPLSLQKYSFLY